MTYQTCVLNSLAIGKNRQKRKKEERKEEKDHREREPDSLDGRGAKLSLSIFQIMKSIVSSLAMVSAMMWTSLYPGRDTSKHMLPSVTYDKFRFPRWV